MKSVFAIALLTLIGCACPKPIPPPGPSPVVDAGVPEEETDADEVTRPCLAACRRLIKLGCEAGKPTPEGTSCTRVCENVQSSGVVSWNINCIKTATSCEAADECNQP